MSSICSLTKSLSVLLIFSLVFIDFYANFCYFFPLLLVTCSFSCLHFIYFWKEVGEHLCHNTCREVIGQLERVGSLLEPCGLWGLNCGHQVWLQSLPDSHLAGPTTSIFNDGKNFVIPETSLSNLKFI